MFSETPASPRVFRIDPHAALAAVFCIAALFFDVLGWPMAIIGIVVLRRAAFRPAVKWILAVLALAPKVLFVAVRLLNAPPDLSFTIEPRTLATSPSLWLWSILVACFGVYLLFARIQGYRGTIGNRLLRVAGLVIIAVAPAMLLGLSDDFHRIDDAGNGRWALRHAVRGAVATFSPGELASIDARESRTSRSGSRYSVRVGLADGRTFSASTTSSAAFEAVRKFAISAGLRPGTVRILRRFGRNWTNSATAFTLKNCAGTYEYVDERGGGRRTLEISLQNGRLVGRETENVGQLRRTRTLRDFKIDDTGVAEFQATSFVGASGSSKTAISFSFQWPPKGGLFTGGTSETGRFTKEAFETGSKTYRRR